MAGFTWILLSAQLAFAAAATDAFTVKSVKGRHATLEGNAKGIKEGDHLYFTRSPFKFSVTAAKGNQITIAVPEKNDLTAGDKVLKEVNEQIKKSLEAESRLKQALEE